MRPIRCPMAVLAALPLAFLLTASIASAQTTGAISGTVTDSSDYRVSLSDLTVEVYDATGTTLVRSVLTVGGGSYLVPGLAPGTYFVRTRNTLGYQDEVYSNRPCVGECDVIAGNPVGVSAGSTSGGIDFRLDPLGSISGTVTDSRSGAPVSGISVRVYRANGSSDGSATTATDGSYVIRQLQPGVYYVATSYSAGYRDALYSGIACPGEACTPTTGTPVVVQPAAAVTGIDLALDPLGRITGRVTEEVGGATIPDVSLRLWTASGSYAGSAYSDAAGTYTFEGLEPGSYTVAVSSSSTYVREAWNDHTCASSCTAADGDPITVAEGATVGGIDFALARVSTTTGTITGTVVEAGTGTPLSNRSVRVKRSGQSSYTSGSSNSTGVYSISGLAPGTYLVWVTDPSYPRVHLDQLYNGLPCDRSGCPEGSATLVTVTAGSTATGIDFAMQRGGVISGTVRNSVGASIANASLTVYTAGGSYERTASADSAGRFTVTGLYTGSYVASASASIHLGELYRELPCPGDNCVMTEGTPVAVAAGATTTGVDFTLDAYGQVTGTVTASDTGAPLAGVEIEFRTSLGYAGPTSTDGNGQFAMVLQPGTYFAQTRRAAPYLNQRYDGLPCTTASCDPTAGTPFTVSLGTTTAGIDFALERGAQILGVVRSTASGAGISGLYVDLYASSGAFLSSARTESSGAYQFAGLEPGQYFLTAGSTGTAYRRELYRDIPYDSQAVTTGTPVVLAAGGTAAGIDFSLESWGRVSGRLTDATTGAPISYERVEVKGGERVYSANTDSNGVYAASGVVPGSYTVRTVGVSGYLDEAFDNIPCPGGTCADGTGRLFPISVGTALTGIDFALTPAGQISGTISDRTWNVPLSGTRVSVHRADGTKVGDCTTDAVGQYETPGLQPGLYYLIADNLPGYISAVWDGNDGTACLSCRVTTGKAVAVVGANTTAGIDFRLTRGGRIEGRVVDAGSGSGVFRAAVEIYDSTGTQVLTVAEADGAGRYLTGQGLPPGTYYAKAQENYHQDQLYMGVACPTDSCEVTSGTPIVISGTETVRAIDFSLTGAGYISGTMVAGGSPVGSGRRVLIHDASGQLVRTVTTSGSGFNSRGLPPGTYFVRTDIGSGFIDELYDNIPCPGGACTITAGTPVTVAASGQTYVSFSLSAASCAVSVSPAALNLRSGGGQVQLTVTATDPGCSWTASTTAPWLGFVGTPAGTGSGTLLLQASPNDGADLRTTTVLVGTTPIAIAQDRVPIWYFAEGATVSLLNTRFALVNPDAAETASVLVTFQLVDGQNVCRLLSLPPLSRFTLDCERDVPELSSAEFSTVVESDIPIVVDRTMTWDETGYGSSAERGIAAPATEWYLAEGATFWNFDLYYLIQNPNGQAAQVTITYLRPAPQTPVLQTLTVAPRSRRTIHVDDIPELAAAEISGRIVSSVPVIVERAMYLNRAEQFFAAGHASAGVTAAALEWYFAEGATGPYFDLFILVANPGDTTASVDAVYLLPDGRTVTRRHTVLPYSRYNIYVDDDAPELADTAVATIIRSTNGVPIVAERAMWWPGPTADHWSEAHSSPGATGTGTLWALADGEQGGPAAADTWILVANTSPSAGRIKVTLVFDDGRPAVWREFPVLANSRRNVYLPADFADLFPPGSHWRFGTIVESLESGGAPPVQIVVERAMYSDANGVPWAAGTSTLGTRIR